ncbi:uncharacterized protein M6B38_204415 [Iris pallida]|uniref:Uncharacterized protein n=1 Tax=Iris pallida TaxID=29817 RepID=A0AAX6E771_IRIPA|nr:uncharacterized protein M6B38_204415 [Iris pallida]
MGRGTDLHLCIKVLEQNFYKRGQAFLSLVISTKEAKRDFKDAHEVHDLVVKESVKTEESMEGEVSPAEVRLALNEYRVSFCRSFLEGYQPCVISRATSFLFSEGICRACHNSECQWEDMFLSKKVEGSKDNRHLKEVLEGSKKSTTMDIVPRPYSEEVRE